MTVRKCRFVVSWILRTHFLVHFETNELHGTLHKLFPALVRQTVTRLHMLSLLSGPFSLLSVGFFGCLWNYSMPLLDSSMRTADRHMKKLINFFAVLRAHLKQQFYLASDHKTGKSVAGTLTLSHRDAPLYTPIHVSVCVCTLTAIERRISMTLFSFLYRARK